MPVTPFHFGPGLALKGGAAPVFSWTAFAVATVLIDCESLYYLVRQEYPVHRFLHSLAGASLVGLLAALACYAFFPIVSLRAPEAVGVATRGERAGLGALLGGLAGGLSHPVLDGIMHPDVRPFMPWSDRNPFLGLVSETTLHLACVVAAVVGVAGLAFWRRPRERPCRSAARVDAMLKADRALTRLREGNQRFAADRPVAPLFSNTSRRAELVSGQEPFAIILGCSDSRVPAELVFDQGFGDLFVIRVGGNIVAPSQVGSVEFAASRFGTRLVVVMGHSQCGVVAAALEELQGRGGRQSRNLRAIVDRVRPSVETVLAAHRGADAEGLMRDAVRANVRASVDHLRHGSDLLERLIQDDGLLVVGAEYSLETGVVDFFDGVPGRLAARSGDGPGEAEHG